MTEKERMLAGKLYCPFKVGDNSWEKSRACRRLHAVEVEAVIEHPSCIVPEGRLEMTGETPPHGQQFLQGKFLERRVFFKKCIQIVNICLKVAVVMQTHRLLVDIRFESVVRIWQRCVDKRITAVHR